MKLDFQALPTDTVRALQAGGPDANGRIPEPAVSDGAGNPCRHCLKQIEAGRGMLILAHRPFPELQPYAEVGPIFLCAEPCERHPGGADLPGILDNKDHILMRGYTADDRIKYGTGQIVEISDLTDAASALFENGDVAYIHLRSSTNNCYQCRIERA